MWNVNHSWNRLGVTFYFLILDQRSVIGFPASPLDPRLGMSSTVVDAESLEMGRGRGARLRARRPSFFWLFFTGWGRGMDPLPLVPPPPGSATAVGIVNCKSPRVSPDWDLNAFYSNSFLIVFRPYMSDPHPGWLIRSFCIDRPVDWPFISWWSEA